MNKAILRPGALNHRYLRRLAKRQAVLKSTIIARPDVAIVNTRVNGMTVRKPVMR